MHNDKPAPHYMLVANDEKVTWDAAGKIHFLAAGNDHLMIFDIGSDPAQPRHVITIPVENSLFGPPTNLAITPDNTLALLANPMRWREQDGVWTPGPGNLLHVVDLTLQPPAMIATLEVGPQPSGMAINRAGTLALIANRADHSISVLRIRDKQVSLIGTVAVDGHPVAVAFDADGRRAFFAKMETHTLGVLQIDGENVSYQHEADIPTGLVPYNLVITPDGTLALTVDMGHPNASDGHADTISIIDIAANPPRVTNKVVVDDAPEGLVMSPTGTHAAAIVIQGSNCDHEAWFYHRNGKVVLLKIDGAQVTRVSEIDVGALPEGAVFSPDGRYLYVGNFLDADMSVLRIDGDTLVDTDTRIALGGHPAAMRSQSF